MRTQPWKRFGCLAAVLIAGYQILPENIWVRTVWQLGAGYGAVIAIVAGIRRMDPKHRLPWWCFAVAIGASTTGIAASTLISVVFHQAGYPSLADPWWLSLYPAGAIGLGLMIRRRHASRDWTAMVDTTTITTGLGLLAWLFVIQPAAMSHEVTLLGRIVQAAYPVGDVLLLAMLVRLMRGAGSRGVAHWLMTGSVALFLLGDASWIIVGDLGLDIAALPSPVSRALQMVYLAAYAAFGIAALHPSAARVCDPATPRPPRRSAVQRALLTFASMVAPAVLLAGILQGAVTGGVAVAVGSAALFLLVVTWIARLLRQLETQARYIRDLVRQDELTGLPNRRAWNDELPRALDRARRYGDPLCVAILDLDFFQRINDRYGRPAGDRLLKEAAAAWSGQLRAVDTLARYGGEEFISLLPGADEVQASAVLARMSAATPLAQTFSGGIAEWDGKETPDQLVARAAAALQAAKAAGRDRVRTAAAQVPTL
ncbi:MAG: hypothetical protein QOJ50_114 [Cryptosporangiaceae bacterium]|nr:hypothetical protein [Cryptosporangiaceae bacterium]